MSDGGPPRAGRLTGPIWPRRWLAARTLRGRLIAGLVALLVFIGVAVGVSSYIELRGLLLSQLHQNLLAGSQRYVACLTSPQPEHDGENGSENGAGLAGPTANAPETCAGQVGGVNTFTAQRRGGAITQAYNSDGAGVLSAADKRALAVTPPPSDYTTVELSQLGTYLVYAADSGKPDLVYLIGMPLAPVEHTLREVEIVEAVAFAAALLMTMVLGTGWVRLSLRPLRRVAATATRVTQLPLGSGEVGPIERVPDTDPRTEVGQVGAAFNRMLEHVEAALARRAASEARLRRFAADASHELRTPLAAIRGYAELARRHRGPVPDDIAHALGRVEAESARMSLLVDELLLLAQLDAGRPLAAEPVDLTLLAIDATSDARVASPDHKWQLELPDEPVVVRGDEHRLRQVLANLLSNAAKHTPPGTVVTVTLDEPDPATDSVTLRVTDNGPGIPPDLLPGLFERFVRGDSSRSHAAGSTGLGLAIVDAVAAAHGGSVSVSSKPGWTQFVMTLPGLELSLRPADRPAGRPRRDGPAAPHDGAADDTTVTRGRAAPVQQINSDRA